MAIGRTNAGGGGPALNFKVVGGTVEPASPKENTIWVNTSVPIPEYIFSATAPSSKETGTVWITVGNASPVAFNALRKNGVYVYPLSVKQYDGSLWVDRAAAVYKNGSWDNSLSKYYFYNRGNAENSGGFGRNSETNVVFNEDHIYLQGAESINIFLHSYNAVPVDYKKMVIVGEVVSQINYVCFQGCGMAEAKGWTVDAMWDYSAVGKFTKTVDISAVNDAQHRYVKIAMGTSPSCIGKIYEIYFTM